MPEGATVVLYTDGLIEDRERTIDDGLELLRDVAASASDVAPEALCDHVLRALGREAGGEDDIALLVMRA